MGALEHAVLEGIKAWLREDAPVAIKMMMLPEQAQQLVRKIVVELKRD
jgi:hypothetical protein